MKMLSTQALLINSIKAEIFFYAEQIKRENILLFLTNTPRQQRVFRKKNIDISM